ncbi:chorismate mutase [Plantactinospora sp. WMMC1484]|uniref:chorismate mutase n=1 Tax=Plantactinospora sp. WMMC1484 TaxID=3404122 RepID=UPI003BF537FA
MAAEVAAEVAEQPVESNGAEPVTGTSAPEASEHILGLRGRIDEIDHELIALWRERAALSQQVGRTRMASGGTRLVLSREREILDRFREALGADGTQLALLLLRAGRGPL